MTARRLEASSIFDLYQQARFQTAFQLRDEAEIIW